jgi:hypothetical protein
LTIATNHCWNLKIKQERQTAVQRESDNDCECGKKKKEKNDVREEIEL